MLLLFGLDDVEEDLGKLQEPWKARMSSAELGNIQHLF